MGTRNASLRENCPYSEVFWFGFSLIWTENDKILRISQYSLQMRENTDQKNQNTYAFCAVTRR